MKVHTLLDGREIDACALGKRGMAFLDGLRRMADEGLSYFEILRMAIGPGSPALEGRSTVNAPLAESPLYLVARDIATRAGIKEGLILAPEHESMRASVPRDSSFISVTQTANLIGVSRSAVHQAIDGGKIKTQRFGHVLLVLRASAEEYQRERRQRLSGGVRLQSKPAAAQRGESEGRQSARLVAKAR